MIGRYECRYSTKHSVLSIDKVMDEVLDDLEFSTGDTYDDVVVYCILFPVLHPWRTNLITHWRLM